MSQTPAQPILLVLLGPTGVGKTELSLRLAEEYECPILNADSRQIYRDLPIGTAAPTAEQQARVRHYFVATHSLEQDYNAGSFERDAIAVLNGLCCHDEQTPPVTCPTEKPFALLAGGAMLYIDAVCNGLDAIPTIPDPVRVRVREGYQTGGLTWLQEQVQALDPAYWQTVDRSNPQRLMHCIEICQLTGGTYSQLRTAARQTRPFRVLKVGLTRTREDLYERINRRCDLMMEQGLLDEAQHAFRLFDGRPLPNSLRTVAYNELYRWYKGEWTLQQALQMIKQNSRHYAKRQLTWWRRDNTIHWLNAEQDYETQLDTIAHLLRNAGSMQ